MKGRNSTKLTTMVDFPVYGFDMTPHLANKQNSAMNHSNTMDSYQNPIILGGVGWSPWKRPRKQSNSNDNTYDLYAVCYHHGSDLETGHYTAACKNPYDNQWYLYDDTKVTNLSQSHNDIRSTLVNNSAYILFYQKRSGVYVGSSSNSSSAASTSSVGSMNDHWVSRMPKFSYVPPKNDKKINTTNSTNNKKPNENTTEEKDNTKSDVISENKENNSTTPSPIKNSTSLDKISTPNSPKKLEKSTNTPLSSQVSLLVTQKVEPKPMYTTSIYINAAGNVDIKTDKVVENNFNNNSPVISNHRVNGISEKDVELSLDERNSGFYRGNRGYATLNTVGHRHTFSGEGEKIYHSDDEAPPVAHSWVSILCNWF